METEGQRSRTAFVVSEKFERFSPPPGFPYEMDRGSRILKLCRQSSMMGKPWMKVIDAVAAAPRDMLRFHTQRYLDALKEAGEGEFRPEFLEFGIGSQDCPMFHGLLDYCLLAAGATLSALRAIHDLKFAVAFNPAGGLHHGGPEKAEGFCYTNDVAIAIKTLKESRPGIRIGYVDIDAHHANGVQDAFYDDDSVLVISMHQSGRTLYPGTGFANEIGEGKGRGTTINIPLEPQSDDDVFREAFDEIVVPAVQAYRPDLLIMQLGVDMHHSDPLTDLNMTDSSFAYAVRSAIAFGLPLLALGGGGYNRDVYIRTNVLLWSIMNGIDTEEDWRGLVGGVLIGDPGAAPAVGLREPRRYTVGEAKQRAVDSVRRTIAWLKQNIPLLGT